MPFNKKSTNEVKEQTLPNALGISENRSDTIAEEVHHLMLSLAEGEGDCRRLDNSKFLLAMYNKYDDKELLYAVYVGSRMLSNHTNPGARIMGDLLKAILEK